MFRTTVEQHGYKHILNISELEFPVQTFHKSLTMSYHDKESIS